MSCKKCMLASFKQIIFGLFISALINPVHAAKLIPADTSHWAGLMHSQWYLSSCALGLSLVVFHNCVKSFNYKWGNPVHSLSYTIHPTHTKVKG
jgi:hypothetical protein